MSTLAKAIAFAAENADTLDDLVEVAKLGADTYRAVHSWVNGDGPEPVEHLAKVPDLTRLRLAEARLERIAAGG